MIRIIEAIYGGADVKELLNKEIKDGHINIKASNSIFGDPRPGVGKTLKVIYEINGIEKTSEVIEENIFNTNEIIKPIVDILIPFRSVDEFRIRNLFFTVRYYKKYIPNSNIIIIESDSDTDITEIKDLVSKHLKIRTNNKVFCRSMSFNQGFNLRTSDYIILADADMVLDKNILINFESYKSIIDSKFVLPYNTACLFLTEEETTNFIENKLINESKNENLKTRHICNMVGGAGFISAKNYALLNGFDEKFIGWGGEDDDFYYRAAITIGTHRLDGDLVHLEHQIIRSYDAITSEEPAQIISPIVPYKKKVLCFTTSYNRPKMLRGCIQDILNQSYPNIMHSINYAHDTDVTPNYQALIFDDLLKLTNRVNMVFNKNEHPQDNYINAIKGIPNYLDYDLYIKIDDDDMYKTNYVANIVKAFEDESIDVSSSYINGQLNGHIMKGGNFNNFGANPEGSDYHMPMTFAFNRKGLDLIMDIPVRYHFEDVMWRDLWSANNLKHITVDNSNQVIWNIHGKNISTASFLKKEISFVLTSCGRPDLLEQTIDSFLKFNTYPITEYLIIDDSTNPELFNELVKKYNYLGIKWFFNYERNGQIKSLDKLYSNIKTEYIFHCEDDWVFTDYSFIEKSFKILEDDNTIIMVSLRDHNDTMGHPIIILDNLDFDLLEYKNYHYGGFSFNPGLRRLKDYKLIENYENIGHERDISNKYKELGFKAAILKTKYVEHIGWNRHVKDVIEL